MLLCFLQWFLSPFDQTRDSGWEKKKKHKSPQLGFVDDSKNGATNQTQNSSRQPHNKLRQTTKIKYWLFFIGPHLLPCSVTHFSPLIKQAITHVFPQQAVIHCGDGPRYTHAVTYTELAPWKQPTRPTKHHVIDHFLSILYHTATCPLPTASFCFSLSLFFNRHIADREREKVTFDISFELSIIFSTRIYCHILFNSPKKGTE